MAPEYALNRQDDLLIAVVLAEYAREWEEIESWNAERAWFLCCVVCERHGLSPSEAVLELE